MQQELTAIGATADESGTQLRLRWLRHCIPRQLSDQAQPSPQSWPRWPNDWQHGWGGRRISKEFSTRQKSYFWPHAWWHYARLHRHFCHQARMAWESPQDHHFSKPSAKQVAERTALQAEAQRIVCPHQMAWLKEQNPQSYMTFHIETQLANNEICAKCDACLLPLVAQAVRFRFEGDGERRRAWLAERERECTQYARFRGLYFAEDREVSLLHPLRGCCHVECHCTDSRMMFSSLYGGAPYDRPRYPTAAHPRFCHCDCFVYGGRRCDCYDEESEEESGDGQSGAGASGSGELAVMTPEVMRQEAAAEHGARLQEMWDRCRRDWARGRDKLRT